MTQFFHLPEWALSPRTLARYHALVYLLILVLSCAASLVLGKDRNWDLLNYHFYTPYAFLTGRLGFDYLPAQTPTYLNPLMDIPTYLMITHFQPWVVGAIMGVWHGLNLILVYQMTQRVFRFLSPFRVAVLATGTTILSATGSIVWGLWGTFMGDLTVSIFVLASLNVLLSAFELPPGKARTRKIIWAGVLIGLGTGLKATTALYALPLILLAAFFGNSWIARGRTMIVFALACFLGFLMTYGYWAFILQSQFGSPFFPYCNGIFRSPLVAAANLSDFLHWMPKTLLENVRLPFSFFLEGGGLAQAEVPFRDWRPALAFTALLLLAVSLLWRLIRRERLGALFPAATRPMLILVLFFLGSWVLWQVQFAYFRYNAPLGLIIPVVILSASYLIIPRANALAVVLVVLFVLLLPTTRPLNYGRSAWTDDYFQVEIPAALHLEDSQVVIADLDRPLSYFIPFFPPSTQVLRITSHMDQLLYNNPRAVLIDQLDQELHKPLPKFVMYVDEAQADQQMRIKSALAYYGLQLEPAPCSQITSNFLIATLCPVERMTSSP